MAANKRKYSQEYLDSQLEILKNGIIMREVMILEKEIEIMEWKELALSTMEKLENFDYKAGLYNTLSLLITERSKK